MYDSHSQSSECSDTNEPLDILIIGKDPKSVSQRKDCTAHAGRSPEVMARMRLCASEKGQRNCVEVGRGRWKREKERCQSSETCLLRYQLRIRWGQISRELSNELH
jgi:hypothetical protein